MTPPPIDPTIFVTIFAWVWATYGEKIVTKTTEEVWKKVEWRLAAKEYSRKVRRRYSTTRILGKPDPVPLEGLYTDVQVLDKPMAIHRFTVRQLEEQYSQHAMAHQYGSRSEGLTIVQQTDKLFILGKPGAGKTTFCQYIALQALEGHLERVPIFVSLKELADSGMTVLEFVVAQFDICGFPEAQPFIEQLLKAGKAIVLFDGLDEVQQADDKQIALTTDIKNFVNKYDESHYLITCRIAATEYTFERFTYVEMADFTRKQIETFVGKWFGDADERRYAFLEELWKPEHRGLQELSQTPLLLTLLCLTFEETLYFPHRRVEIYEEALDALLKKWDASRNIRRDDIYRKLSLGRKRQMLARISARTFEEGQYFIPEQALAEQIEDYLRRVPTDDANEEIDGFVVLKAIEAQHGIFSERARHIYSLAHLTFQEYFTSRYIVENAARGTLNGLVRQHLTEPRWREVFLLTASMLDVADDFIELMLVQLNDLAASDKSPATLLSQVTLKGDAALSNLRPVVARTLSLALALDLALVRVLDPALAYVLVHRHGYYHDNERILSSILSRAKDLAVTLASALDLLPKLDNELAKALNLMDNAEGLRALARTLTNYIELAVDGALIRIPPRDLNLAHALASVLAFDLQDVRTFARTFAHFDTHPLNRYLTAAKLILDCVQLAYVSDKAAIEDRLLMPPQQPPS